MSDEVKRWIDLPDEQRLLENSYYKNHYEGAAEWLGRTVPPWEDLTHEQRDAVRRECIRYGREMQEFGESLTR